MDGAFLISRQHKLYDQSFLAVKCKIKSRSTGGRSRDRPLIGLSPTEVDSGDTFNRIGRDSAGKYVLYKIPSQLEQTLIKDLRVDLLPGSTRTQLYLLSLGLAIQGYLIRCRIRRNRVADCDRRMGIACEEKSDRAHVR